ncbi:hypothetical protein ACH5RR_016730 [Cinchona calisaya]|uniref:BED-type domain-containing protein n=1 Tax=Cinchona calisaya TaxID=153742 RepID=A0ABD2ZWT2_9GENT
MEGQMEGQYEHEVEQMSSTDTTLPQSVDTAGRSSAKHTRTRKLTSLAWEGFDNLPMSADGKKRVKCKWCLQTYSVKANFGTTNMLKHYGSCKWRELEIFGGRSPLDQSVYREKITIAIIKHNYPFQFVEREGIRDLHKYLNEEAIPISRNTIKVDVIRMYSRERDNLKRALGQVKSRICLTFDLWSSCTTDGVSSPYGSLY